MNILIFSHVLPPYFGVGTFRISSLISEMVKQGHSVTVITSIPEANNGTFLDKLTVGARRDLIRSNSSKARVVYEYLKKAIYYKKKNIDVVLFTGSPFFYFPISMVFKHVGIKVILDFRDPWVLRPEFNDFKYKFLKVFEYISIKSSTTCVVVNEYVKDMYVNKYPQYSNKFHVVENGYFSEVTNEINTNVVEKKDVINLIYAGKFGIRNFMPLVKLLEENNNYILTYVGDPEKNFVDCINEHKVAVNKIKILGKCSYESTLEIIKKADIAILITSGEDWEPTTKIYDYLSMQTPVIAINATQTGYVNKVLVETNSGVICDNNMDSIKKAILLCESEVFSFDNIEKYEREKLSENYMKLISSMCE